MACRAADYSLFCTLRMPTPEAIAREKIDELLIAAGWIIQDYKKLNLGAGKGIAIREVPLKTGP